jgi:CheY-like chemotaxis protein/chemotaxis protein CheY-P-specific phosphatase CheC
MVVDDSDIARTLIKDMAASLGHIVVAEADCMKAAINGYSDHKPEVVTLDLSIPGEDGYKILQALRNLDPKATVVIISGNSQKRLKEKLIAAGAACILEKPIRLAELKAALAPFATRTGISESKEKKIVGIITGGINEAVDKLAIMSRSKWKMDVASFMEGMSSTLPYKNDLSECYGAYADIPGAMFLLMFPKKGGSEVAKAFIFSHEAAVALLPDAEKKALAEVANIFIGKIAAEISDHCSITQLIGVPTVTCAPKAELILQAFGDYKPTGNIFSTHIRISSEKMATECHMLIFLDAPIVEQLLNEPQE